MHSHVATSLLSYISPLTQASPCFPTCSHVGVNVPMCVHVCSVTGPVPSAHIKVDVCILLLMGCSSHRARSSSWVLASLLPFALCIPTTNPLPSLNGFSWTTKPLRIILAWSQIGAKSVLQPIHTKIGRKMLIVLLFFFI